MISHVQRFSRSTVRRFLSSEVVKVAGAPNTAGVAAPVAVIPASGGSTFFQRFSSFLTGCGVGFGLSFYFIYNELEESNEKFARDIQLILANANKK